MCKLGATRYSQGIQLSSALAKRTFFTTLNVCPLEAHLPLSRTVMQKKWNFSNQSLVMFDYDRTPILKPSSISKERLMSHEGSTGSTKNPVVAEKEGSSVPTGCGAHAGGPSTTDDFLPLHVVVVVKTAKLIRSNESLSSTCLLGGFLFWGKPFCLFFFHSSCLALCAKYLVPRDEY